MDLTHMLLMCKSEEPSNGERECIVQEGVYGTVMDKCMYDSVAPQREEGEGGSFVSQPL